MFVRPNLPEVVVTCGGARGEGGGGGRGGGDFGHAVIREITTSTGLTSNATDTVKSGNAPISFHRKVKV